MCHYAPLEIPFQMVSLLARIKSFGFDQNAWTMSMASIKFLSPPVHSSSLEGATELKLF